MDDFQFWAYVEVQSDGGFKCKFCEHEFAARTSVTRIKWHLSGERGHGVAICGRVPRDVQETSYLASRGSNKRQKPMPGSSKVYGATNPAPTSPQERNSKCVNLTLNGMETEHQNANPTLSDIENMLFMDGSCKEMQEEGNFICLEPEPHIENWNEESFMQPIQQSINPERSPVDGNETRGAELLSTDLFDPLVGKSMVQILDPRISAALQPLSNNPMSPKFASMEQVDSEIKEWKEKMLLIREMLDDVEEKQLTNPAMHNLLSGIRDLAYDVEDILDEFETVALQIKLKSAESQASTRTVQRCAMPNMETQSKLEITARLDEIIKAKNILDLGTNAGRSSNRMHKRVPTTSLMKESYVYGREKVKEDLVKLLMSEEPGSSVYSVISIAGMGGIGKTTLAQLVYNDNRLNFDHKAWVYVSDDFDIPRITKTLLQHWESCEDNNLNVFQERLKKKLLGKKFFIVLDDVWQHRYDDWTALCSPFAVGAPGSKIIVTTRIKAISTRISSRISYELKELPYDECLHIFAQHAMDAENFDAHPDLKEVGQKIVEKCKGLPLAAKTLGGLLRHKQHIHEWEDILNSEVWDLPEEECGILLALRLSYHYLPSYLKRCFSYCAIFPKDYEFDKDDLILLWMAEGFLQQPWKKQQEKDVGKKYFHDLLSRSFFQKSSSNGSRYVMHDFLHDLAQFVSGETWFQLDDKGRGVKSHAKVRHSSFIPNMYETWKRFEVFQEMKTLRTFIALPPSLATDDYFYLSNKVLDDLVPNLKCLRALSLAHYYFKELPNSICSLKHLRYFNLSYTSIERLPESLGELLNLETLKLCGCRELVELPACIGNLINLQCLDVSGTRSLQKMPSEIGKLKNLVTLPKVIVGEGGGLRIGELKNLPHLQGQLHIIGLHNIANINEAKYANLEEKQGLRELALEWSNDFHDAQSEIYKGRVLNSLQLHQSLEKLSITSYGGTVFPLWAGDPSFTKLVDLELRNCRRITSLQSLGKLPTLRKLKLEGMNEVKEVVVEGFLCLETLIIDDMVGWEQWCWSSDGLNEAVTVKFPKLHELTLENCPKLVGNWPRCLPSVKKLKIRCCLQLADLPEALPSLSELDVENCHGAIFRSVHCFTSLIKLKISRISGLVSLHERVVFLHGSVVQGLVGLVDLSIEKCKQLKYLWEDGYALGKLANLKSLKVEDCHQLVSLVKGEEGPLPCNLQVLHILWCENLETLPNGLYSLPLLRELKVSGCSRLISFPKGADLPCSLQSLVIQGCKFLESLPDGIMTTTMNGNGCVLEELRIHECPSLKYFPRGGRLPTSLKQLWIDGCEKLFEGGMFHSDASDMSRCSHLESLLISNSPLTSFPTGFQFPTSLKTLKISNCKMMKSLPSLHALSLLSRLEIAHFDELEFFPECGLPLPNLIKFDIKNCKKLRCLPNHVECLISLQHLDIESCSSMESFPEKGFPPNLISLRIVNCGKLAQQPLSDWGLFILTYLKDLTIDFKSAYTRGGKDVYYHCFPDVDCLLLPNSLKELCIKNHENLRSISRGLQHLTSLEKLWINNCPKLQLLPKEGFPPTLGYLEIGGCPLIKERLNKGDYYWPIVSHIPCIMLDEVDITTVNHINFLQVDIS